MEIFAVPNEWAIADCGWGHDLTPDAEAVPGEDSHIREETRNDEIENHHHGQYCAVRVRGRWDRVGAGLHDRYHPE